MDEAEYYLQLGQLLNSMPELGTRTRNNDTMMWLARLRALLQRRGGSAFKLFEVGMDQLDANTPNMRESGSKKVTQALYNALAAASLESPTEIQGAFIPVGNAHDGFVAVGKILGLAESTVLIVDPYADHKLLETFAVTAKEGVHVHILTDIADVKPTLRPAVSTWITQYASRRPLEVRLSPPKTLHDRLIIVDKSKTWAVGQSFKDLANRAPTTFTRVDAETANMKIGAYEDLWRAAAPI